MTKVFLWREMPDFERLKPYPENAGYRQWFYRHWGSENCIVSGIGRNAEYLPWRHRLSIKVARGGREWYFLDGRSIAVDDDSYLILNDDRTYASRFDPNVDMESFSIFFRPGMAQEVCGALNAPIERALARGGEETPRPTEFSESLRVHDSAVMPVLRYVEYGVKSGVDDSDWYEEQLHFLLERMFIHERGFEQRISRLSALKASTQREIGRRLALAVDLVHSSYDKDVCFADMAQAACLSKFHFLRLFTELHGITPHAYLQRKRALVAQRLLAEGRLTASQVALKAGFWSRSTMRRQIRRHCGAGP